MPKMCKGFLPGFRVQVDRIDESAVDVENDSSDQLTPFSADRRRPPPRRNRGATGVGGRESVASRRITLRAGFPRVALTTTCRSNRRRSRPKTAASAIITRTGEQKERGGRLRALAPSDGLACFAAGRPFEYEVKSGGTYGRIKAFMEGTHSLQNRTTYAQFARYCGRARLCRHRRHGSEPKPAG